MRGKMQLVVGMLLVAGVVQASSFILKSESSGRRYGPFRYKDGTKVPIGKAMFILVTSESGGDDEAKGVPPDQDYGDGLRASRRAGECELKEMKDLFDQDAAFSVSLGVWIKTTCRFYIGDFMGKKIIWAGAELENSTSGPMHYSYCVSFFDAKKGLIGSTSHASGATGLKPGIKTQLGNCFVPLPHADVDRVKYYQVVLYESKEDIGKR